MNLFANSNTGVEARRYDLRSGEASGLHRTNQTVAVAGQGIGAKQRTAEASDCIWENLIEPKLDGSQNGCAQNLGSNATALASSEIQLG